MTQANALRAYTAVINEDREWEWTSAGHRPPEPVAGKPRFKKGHGLAVRLKTCLPGCAGPHRMVLTPSDALSPVPFKVPFAALDFGYKPDQDIFEFEGPGTKDPVDWKFALFCGKQSIDPEFQVGPGGFGEDHDAPA